MSYWISIYILWGFSLKYIVIICKDMLLAVLNFMFQTLSLIIDIKTSRKTMEYLNNKLEIKYGDIYNEVKLPILCFF